MFSNIFRLVSNVIVTAVLAWFLARGLSEGSAYIIMAVAFALLAFGGFYGQFAMTKGFDGEGSELASRATKKGKKGVSLIDVFKNLFTNPQLLYLFIANTCTSCVSYILTKLAVYYWRYVAENFAMMGTY